MPITVGELSAAAAEIFGVTRHEIVGPSREHRIFRARAAVCWVAHRSGRSLADIGRSLGGRKKNPIHNAVGRADQMAMADIDFEAARARMLNLARDWAAAHAQGRSPAFLDRP